MKPTGKEGNGGERGEPAHFAGKAHAKRKRKKLAETYAPLNEASKRKLITEYPDLTHSLKVHQEVKEIDPGRPVRSLSLSKKARIVTNKQGRFTIYFERGELVFIIIRRKEHRSSLIWLR